MAELARARSNRAAMAVQRRRERHIIPTRKECGSNCSVVAFAPLSNFADMLGSRLARFELAGEHGGARANWRLVHARVRVSGRGMLSFALRSIAVGFRASCMYAPVG